MPSQIIIRDPTAYTERPKNTVLGVDDIASISSNTFHGFVQPVGVNERRKDARPTGGAASIVLLDISASQRLFGYFFCCIASVVSLISSSIFYAQVTGVVADFDTIGSHAMFNITLSTKQQQIGHELSAALDNEKFVYFYGSHGSIVQDWKAYGSIAVSGLLALITMLVLIAHFDSYFFPNTFRRFFADGSKSERNLLIVLILIAMCALEINTSRFSVGQAQPNVFFSTWMVFVGSVCNHEVWRRNAGRHFTFQNILFDSRKPTMRFWFLLAIITAVTLLAFIEHTMHNNFLVNSDNEGDLNCMVLSLNNVWMWLGVAGCLFAWTALRYSYKLSLGLAWIIEMGCSAALVGIYGAALNTFTGSTGFDRIPCPSNLYFGLWLGLFSSLNFVSYSRSFFLF